MPCYFYLSLDELAMKIYLCDRLNVRIGQVGHGNSTALVLCRLYLQSNLVTMGNKSFQLQWAMYSVRSQ
jgi:hypothetical protein